MTLYLIDKAEDSVDARKLCEAGARDKCLMRRQLTALAA
jgi:hypothetical protein